MYRSRYLEVQLLFLRARYGHNAVSCSISVVRTSASFLWLLNSLTGYQHWPDWPYSNILVVTLLTKMPQLQQWLPHSFFANCTRWLTYDKYWLLIKNNVISFVQAVIPKRGLRFNATSCLIYTSVGEGILYSIELDMSFKPEKSSGIMIYSSQHKNGSGSYTFLCS